MALEEFSRPLSVTLTTSDINVSVEVTYKHLFLGYKPLVIALTFSRDDQPLEFNTCCLNFHNELFFANQRWHGFITDRNSIARLILKKISGRTIGQTRIVFYEGFYGEHRFIPSWKQFINSQKEKMRKSNPNNVDLAGNLHDQVRIAYAVPRIIPLITVSDGMQMNMFPTDLHGPVSQKNYVSSLRQNGKANAQVQRYGTLALSTIEASDFKQAYALGKNHMQDLKDLKYFERLPHVSKTFSLPLPASALSYRELQRCESFDVGIHRIHLYENIHDEKIKDGLTLAHIHQYYAQWRMDHGLITKMLLR